MDIPSNGIINGHFLIFACLASVLAICSGAAFGNFAYRTIRRKNAVVSIGASTKRERLVFLLAKGVRPLMPLAKWLIGKSKLIDDSMQSAHILFSERDINIAKEPLLSDLLTLTLLVLVLGTLIGGSPTFGVAVACIVFIGVISFARNRFAKRNIAMREEIPEALRTLAMSFRSGHSLPQVLHDSSQECKGYLGYLFSVASDRIDMGATPEEALSVMRGNDRVPELSFVAVAMDIQHQSGGRIALVLESAMESIEGELKLARSLRVQTAQAKLSASIVTIMPFVLIALFSLFSPDFLSPFFSSALGMAVLALALIMQLTGVLIVRRMLNVGGD